MRNPIPAFSCDSSRRSLLHIAIASESTEIAKYLSSEPFVQDIMHYLTTRLLEVVNDLADSDGTLVALHQEAHQTIQAWLSRHDDPSAADQWIREVSAAAARRLVPFQDRANRNCLHYLVARDQAELATDIFSPELVSAFANASSRFGGTPLHFCVELDHRGSLQTLLTASGVDLLVPDRHGLNIFQQAISRGRMSIAKMLVDPVASPLDASLRQRFLNAKTHHEGLNPLFLALRTVPSDQGLIGYLHQLNQAQASDTTGLGSSAAHLLAEQYDPERLVRMAQQLGVCLTGAENYLGHTFLDVLRRAFLSKLADNPLWRLSPELHAIAHVRSLPFDRDTVLAAPVTSALPKALTYSDPGHHLNDLQLQAFLTLH